MLSFDAEILVKHKIIIPCFDVASNYAMSSFAINLFPSWHDVEEVSSIL